MTLTRLSSFAGLSALLVASPALPRAQDARAPYVQIATLPRVVDGRGLLSFAFDPTTSRLYAASDYAVFQADMKAALPTLKPLVTRRISRIEIAPEVGRLYFLGIDEIGYIDLRSASPEPVQLLAHNAPTDLTYESSKQELYVSTFRGPVLVFDAKTGERGPAIEVPGWTARALEGTRGRVFLIMDRKHGLYSIDPATHTLAEWPVAGSISTPARLEADPAGRFLFMASEREIVAIDIARATVAGRFVTYMTPAIAFDPETNLLIATWDDDPPPTRVVAFRVDENGLGARAQLENPAIGRSGLQSMYGGFMQRGVRDWIVWRKR